MSAQDRGKSITCEKNWFGSCSIRVDANLFTYDAGVDKFDIEEDHPNSNDDTNIESDDDEDAGISSIANDCSSEDEDTLDDDNKYERNFSHYTQGELDR